MTFNNVKELANKFAQNELNEKFNAQRDMLEHFTSKFHKLFSKILSEIEGDVLVLKHKKLNKDVLNELIKLWKTLQEIYLRQDEKTPYTKAISVINFLEDKKNKIIINNLEFLINDHLNKTKIESKEGNKIGQIKFNSLKHLLIFVKEIKNHLENNPLLPDPRTTDTIAPPRMGVINDPEYKSGLPTDKTNPDIKLI